MSIAELSIKRPSLIVVIFTLFVLLGIYSYTSLNYELFPKFTSPVFTVMTIYPGAAPQEVETRVSREIEDALSGLENISSLRTISQESVSLVIIELKFGADLDFLLQEAQRKVNAIRGLMPEGVEDPIVTKYSMDDFPILNMGITADMNTAELYDLVNHRLKPVLSSIEGVGRVQILGGREREIHIDLKSEVMNQLNITPSEVIQAVRVAGIELPAGELEEEQRKSQIRLSAAFSRVEDLGQIVLRKSMDGSLVKLEDIASISDRLKEAESLFRINGIPSIGLTVNKQADANAVEVSQRVHKKLSELEKNYVNENLHVHIADDTTVFTLEAADDVMNDLLNAIILVTLVMLVFLHSIRNAIIVMVSVPLSLLSAFLVMFLFHFTLNLMTLLALSLVIGVLVDDAIVVLENIFRHLEMGKSPFRASIEGAREISLTVISTTLVLIVVFIPVAVAPSLISPILKPYALVIAFSVLISLFVAFTVVPLLASRFSRLESLTNTSRSGRLFLWFESAIDQVGDFFHRLLSFCLRRKAITFISTSLIFFASLLLPGLGFIGSEFLNPGDMGRFIIQMELPPQTNLEKTQKTVRKVEEYMLEKPDIVGVFSTIGSSNEFLAIQGGSHKAEITVKLISAEDRDISSSEYAHQVKKELRSLIPGCVFRTAIASLVGGSDVSPIQVVVGSVQADSLRIYAGKIESIFRKVAGTQDIRTSKDAASTEIVVQIDHEKMADLGLHMAQVAPALQTAFQGNRDVKFRDQNHEYGIRIRYTNPDRNDWADLEKMKFRNLAGELISLDQFARLSLQNTSSKLERYARIPSVMIESQVVGRPAGDVGEDIKQAIAQMNLPSIVKVYYEGDMKYQAEAFNSLGIAFLASILLVYLIMVALYESYVYPLVVMFSVPLSVIGAFLALALTSEPLSIFSLLGLIMLIGIVIKNAILLVDFANQLKKNGYSSLHAVLQSARLRLRPILMTSLSLIIGLLPLALSGGSASAWKNGLAWVIIGGLSSSMLLSLVIVPVVFHTVDQWKERFTSGTSEKTK